MEKKRNLSVLTACTMAVSAIGISVMAEDTVSTWNGEADRAWYGDGTATSYTITDADDLAGLAELVNEGISFKDKKITLESDIDLANKTWTPIGTSIYDKNPDDTDVKMFAGSFDGNGHTITGLTSDGYVPLVADTESTEYSFGLFGYVYGANISNINLADVKIDGTTRKNSGDEDVCGSGVAALIGYYFTADEQTSVIENCHVLSGTVTASNNMGGLIGFMDSQTSQPTVDITIKDCSNAANVTSEAREAGGIVGLLQSSRPTNNIYVSMSGNIDFINCLNTGDITTLDGGGATRVGGILGNDQNEAGGQRIKILFDHCQNSGTITACAKGETHAGGIGVSYYSHGGWLIAKNCSNTGKVEVKQPGDNDIYAGGIFSYAGVIDLISSNSTGTVTVGEENGNKYVGDVAAILFLEEMENFTDEISGNTYYLNGGVSPEFEALVDDSGNFHLVETAKKEDAEFEGWFDNAQCTGEAYTALSTSVDTYYAKWNTEDEEEASATCVNTVYGVYSGTGNYSGDKATAILSTITPGNASIGTITWVLNEKTNTANASSITGEGSVCYGLVYPDDLGLTVGQYVLDMEVYIQ